MSAVLRSNRIKQTLLEAMKIPIWIKPLEGIRSKNNLMGAHCLVLLFGDPNTLNATEQKVLEGMLNVLPIEINNIHVSWVAKISSSLPLEFSAMLLKFVPHTVLIMGETLAKAVLNTPEASFLEGLPIQVTYHPSELSKEPSNKAKAYKDLLNLKALLEKLGVK